jgi:glutathione S-transferase
MLKFFHARGSCSLASHIALEDADAKYEAVRLDFSKSQQRGAEYLAVNPKGRVPALATDRGVISENPAILLWIAQTYPAAKLAPLDDPFALGQMQALNGYLSSTVHVAHAPKLRGARWSDDAAVVEALKLKVAQNMGDCFELIENEFFKGPWAMGDHYTVADPYLYTVATWLEGDGVDIARFPKVADHFKRMGERAAVKRALAANS